MEEMITQDYEFNMKSLVYGKFLQEVHESYPDVMITTVTSLYDDMRTKLDHTVLSVSVPAHVATVLKLRFGVHLRTRPSVKNKADDVLDELEKIKKKIAKTLPYQPWEYIESDKSDIWEKGVDKDMYKRWINANDYKFYK